MNITFSASRQSKLLRRRRYPLPSKLSSLHRHNSTDNKWDLPPKDDKSLVNQVVELLEAPAKDWNSDKLQPLLFSASATLPHELLRITLRLGSSDKALNFLEYVRENAQSEQYPTLPSVFQGILELSSREPDSKIKLLEVYRTSKQWQVPLTKKSATLLIQSFGEAGMVDESLVLFNELDPTLKSTRLCNTLVGVLLRLGRIDAAFHVLDEMLEPNAEFPPNGVTGGIVFADLVKRERPGRSIPEEDVVRLVRKLGEHSIFPDTFKLTQLITMLCGKRKTDFAWDLLHDVIKLGGEVEAASCNALLTGLGRVRDFKRMNDLLAKMKEMKIQPNVVTFGILINNFCKCWRIHEALEVFEKMREKGDNNWINVEPDAVIFNTLIDALCKVGKEEEGLILLEQMKTQSKHRPTTVTYNCLIDGFCKASNIDKANELYNQMNEEGLLPTVVTLNILVGGMCRLGRVGSAVQFFREMQKKGLRGNAITYTGLISAFCNVNNIDKAMQYFDEMLSSGCSPDAIVYYSLISGLSLAGRMDDACHVVSKLKHAGFGLDVSCYNVLISGFCKKKKLERVHEMLKDMEQTGVKPDVVTYNTLVSYLSEIGNFATASEVMRKMISEGLKPTVVTFGALIHAYCKHNNIDEAMNLFREMCSKSSVPPNTVIYNILLDSLCKNNDVEEAVSLWDDMKVREVRPNTTTYNAIFKGLRDKNMLHKAFELMDRMIEDACNPDYITMEILTEWLPAVGEMEKLKKFVQGYQVSSCTA